MFKAPSKFPSSDGKIVLALRTGLIARSWSASISVSRKLPATKTREMVTVRNDSGPQELSRSTRRYGVNVWADNGLPASGTQAEPSVRAEALALDAMSVLQTIADGAPIASVENFSGPYEIDDDVPYTVAITGGVKNLAHYYFTFTCTVRAVAP